MNTSSEQSMDMYRKAAMNASIIGRVASQGPQNVCHGTPPLGTSNTNTALLSLDEIAAKLAGNVCTSSYEGCGTAAPNESTLEELRVASAALVTRYDEEQAIPIYFNEQLITPRRNIRKIRAKLKLTAKAKPRVWIAENDLD